MTKSRLGYYIGDMIGTWTGFGIHYYAYRQQPPENKSYLLYAASPPLVSKAGSLLGARALPNYPMSALTTTIFQGAPARHLALNVGLFAVAYVRYRNKIRENQLEQPPSPRLG